MVCINLDGLSHRSMAGWERNAEGKFQCTSCSKTYKYNSGLWKHRHYECGRPPPFQCSFCPKSFTRKENLLMHSRSFHRQDPLDTRPQNKTALMWKPINLMLNSLFKLTTNYLTKISECRECGLDSQKLNQRLNHLYLYLRILVNSTTTQLTREAFDYNIETTCLSLQQVILLN